jgi:ubiquinone/menaquinone biosynthesis C-methylase UbiE
VLGLLSGLRRKSCWTIAERAGGRHPDGLQHLRFLAGRRPVMGSVNRDAYRRVARWYDRIFGGMNAGLRGIGLKMFPPREAMEVLDVGCGTGIQLACYQQAGCRVTGIDASPAMLELARRRLGQGASLYLGDAAAMPYPGQAFDLVMAATVLHEMPAKVRAAALGEMQRVLRPGGRILLIDFEAGPVRSLRGWVTRGVIAASEVAAGRSHHRNYRDFMAHGGLPPLVDAQGLSVGQRKIVSGGAIGLYLLHTQGLDLTSPKDASTP